MSDLAKAIQDFTALVDFIRQKEIQEWDMYLNPNPKIVELTDPWGNTVSKPNIAKIVADLLSTKKTLSYLDGGEITTEQELRDFIGNVPVKGFGAATISAPITLTAPLYVTQGRQIYLIINTDSGGKITFKAFEAEGVKRLPSIHLEGSSYLHISVRGNPQAPVFDIDLSGVNPATPWDAWLGRRVMFGIVHSEMRLECGLVVSSSDKVITDLSKDPETAFALVARARLFINAAWKDSLGNAHYGYIKMADPNTQKLIELTGYAGLSMGIRLMDATGTDLFLDANGNQLAVVWGDSIRNVVYDTALPTPRNVITPNKLL